MAEITLLRHGQASFGADNYDLLSKIGHQQTRWLGEHFKNQGKSFDRIIIGTMVRHKETTQSMLAGLDADIGVETHAEFNEYNFQGLLEPLKSQHSEQWMATGHARRDYYHNMKQALGYWMSGHIKNDGQDTWQSFCNRVGEGFKLAYHPSLAKRTLIVSSGGPISVILAGILKLDQQKTLDMILQIKNSSISTLLYNRKSFTLDSFNDVGHLMTADKQDNITFS